MTSLSALTFEVTTDNAGSKTLEQGIRQSSGEQIGVHNQTRYILANDEQGIIKGGIRAYKIGQTFIIHLLWVDESMRGRGLGSDLMDRAHKCALDMDCGRMSVDTMSYQAPDFYEAHGYKEKARVSDYYEGYDRIFFERDI